MPDKRRQHIEEAPQRRIGFLYAASGIVGLALIAAVIGGAIYLVFSSGIAFFERLDAPNPARALFALFLGLVLLGTFVARLPQPVTLEDLKAQTIDWYMLAIALGLMVIAADQGGLIRSRNLSFVLMGTASLGAYAASTSTLPTSFATLRKSNTPLLAISLGLIAIGLYGTVT